MERRTRMDKKWIREREERQKKNSRTKKMLDRASRMGEKFRPRSWITAWLRSDLKIRGVWPGGGQGWRVIDFAYDTDWTGLRNWTGFLAGLPSLPFFGESPSRNGPSPPYQTSFFSYIARTSIWLYRRGARIYTSM